MGKVKFDIEAGVLIRRGIRTQLERWKADIQYEESDAVINITENKGFFESYFTFRATNLSDNMVYSIQSVYNKLLAVYS